MKSHLIKSKPNTLLTSTTGITALNLGSSIRTINSTLGFFNRRELSMKAQKDEILLRLLKISLLYKYIAIDEVSMMSGEVVDLIVREIARHNKVVLESKKYSKKHNLLGLYLVGDAGQLPFVADRDDLNEGISASPFFKASAIKFFKTTNLTEIKRQNDKEFVEVLGYLRYGKAKEVVDWFADRVGFNKEIDNDWEGATFFPTNEQVRQYNEYKLNLIKTPEKTYYAEFSGIPNKDWARSIPESITVKPGMKVMILVNNFDEMYANGDLGILKECFPQGILVELFRDKRQVLVNYRTVYNTTIAQKKNGEYYEKRIGSCNYLPIRQGDSSSFHKCLDGNTLISTSKGLVSLKDIKKGDLVLTSDGSYQKVLAHSYSGKKQKVEIVTKERIRINSSPTHPFLVRTKDGVENFKPVTEIKTNDFLCVFRPKDESTTNHYYYSSIKEINYTDDYIDMYDIEVENNPTFVANSVVVHNCQGLTLDEVQLAISGRGLNFLSRLSGGLYTGITRVTNYNGLRLVGSKDDFIRACYINPIYLDYLFKLDSQYSSKSIAA